MIMSCIFHKSRKQEPRTLIAPPPPQNKQPPPEEKKQQQQAPNKNRAPLNPPPPPNIEHADSDDNHTTLHELYTRCRLFSDSLYA